MAASANSKLVGSVVGVLLLASQWAHGQAVLPQPEKGIVYVLPAKTNAIIIRLLAGRTPAYVSVNGQTQEIVLLSFSFEPWSQVTSEDKTLLQTGNRVLKINKNYYGVLIDYDMYFHPQKRHYIDGGGMFNSLDIYVNIAGDYIKHTDWNKGKVNKH